MGPETVEYTDSVCPKPVLHFSLRNPGYGPVFVTTTSTTKYTNGTCDDVYQGVNVRLKGIRETDADKSWDGSVVASEIEIVR
jgi:hypothetical protein